jgi:RimJ/RimL family protein N-acetyltransferase
MVLRKLEENDIELLNIWLHKEHVKQFFGEPTDWINEINFNINNSEWIQYFIVVTQKLPIGFVQYYETDKAPFGIWSNEPEGTVGIDYLIGETKYLKKGHGSKIIKSLVRLIRKTGNYKYIIADPFLENIASISVLSRNSFVKQRNGLFRLIL